jgi:hypothetical protein
MGLITVFLDTSPQNTMPIVLLFNHQKVMFTYHFFYCIVNSFSNCVVFYRREFNQKALQRNTFKCHSRQEICSSNLHSTHFFRQPVDNQLKKKEALALVDYSAIARELGKSIQQHSLQQATVSTYV